MRLIGMLAVCIACCVCDNPIQFPETGEPCIMLKFDSYNSLAWTVNGITQNITLWNFEALTVIDGMCDGQTIDPYVKVRFHVDNSTFTFTLKNNSDMVNVVMVLEFVPDIVFKNGMTDPVSIATEINKVSSMENSYQCDAEQKYDGSASVENDSYNLELIFTRVQMQGFYLENGTFSEGDRCPADTKSTSTLTPSTPTAQTKTGTTLTGTSLTATTPTATTPMPNPSDHPDLTLSIKDDANKTCILLKAQMMITTTGTTPTGTSPTKPTPTGTTPNPSDHPK